MIKNIELFSIPSTLSQFGIFYSVAIVAYYGYSDIAGELTEYAFDASECCGVGVGVGVVVVSWWCGVV